FTNFNGFQPNDDWTFFIADTAPGGQDTLISWSIFIKAPTVLVWTNPASITYGQPLSATQLAATASVDGAFSYNPSAATVLDSGAHVLSATFTPTDTNNYYGGQVSASLTVLPASLTVTANNASRPYGNTNQ